MTTWSMHTLPTMVVRSPATATGPPSAAARGMPSA